MLTTIGYVGATSRIASISRSGATLGFTYDEALPKTESWSGSGLGPVNGASISRTYDNRLGLQETRLHTTSGPDSRVTIDDDQDDRPTVLKVLRPNGTEVARQTLVWSVTSGRLEKRVVQNSAWLASHPAQTDPGGQRAQVKEVYSYNGFGELAELATSDPWLNAYVYREQYPTRDGLGRIVTRIVDPGSGNATHTYGYDAKRGWLVSDTVDGSLADAWSFDVRGNRTGRAVGLAGAETATYDDQDRLLSVGLGPPLQTFGYDLHGRVVSHTTAAGTTTYTWDALGHLLKVKFAPVQGATTTLEYILDPAGRRVAVRQDGQVVTGYLYDGALRIVGRTDAAGKLVERYVYGTLGHSPDFAVRFGGSDGAVLDVFLFAHDQVGSVTGALGIQGSHSGKWWDEQVGYDAWGVATVTAGASAAVLGHPFGFAGGVWDRTTGLVRFGAREYEPELGRWLGRDPVGFSGGWNHYAYVGSDPVGAFDPSGLWPDGPPSSAFGHSSYPELEQQAAWDAFWTLAPWVLNLILPELLPASLPHPGPTLEPRPEPSCQNPPRPTPKFKPPTNPPQLPPTSIPDGFRVREGPRTAQYPNGYWKLEKYDPNRGKWQPIDPSTGKPGSRPETHVPFP